MRSDFDTYYDWLEHCSNSGVTEHQINLASLILTSRTEGKSTVEAYKWLFAANALGNPAAAELLGFMRRSMTAEQVQEADSMFMSWLGLMPETLSTRLQKQMTGVKSYTQPLRIGNH